MVSGTVRNYKWALERFHLESFGTSVFVGLGDANHFFENRMGEL
jgi:hypothetical protein